MFTYLWKSLRKKIEFIFKYVDTKPITEFASDMSDIPLATFIATIQEKDPGTNEDFELNIYRDSHTGRFLAIDASFLIDEDVHVITSPFGHKVELADEYD